MRERGTHCDEAPAGLAVSSTAVLVMTNNIMKVKSQLQTRGGNYAPWYRLRPPSVQFSGTGLGALIVNIDPASPAAKAGLQAGDVILEIDHQPVISPEHALELSRCIKQEYVLLRVWTGRRSRYFFVETGELNRPKPSLTL